MKKKRNEICFPRGSMLKILLRVKLLFVFILLTIVTASANTYSQQTKFNLRLNDVSVRTVFEKIEENSEFILLYDEKKVDVNRIVDVNVDNKSVESLLDQLFEGTKNVYKIYNRQIVILENEKDEVPSIIKSKMEQQEKRKVEGKVTDKNGESIPGVSIVVKGTMNGTITDMDGIFVLDVPAGPVFWLLHLLV